MSPCAIRPPAAYLVSVPRSRSRGVLDYRGSECHPSAAGEGRGGGWACYGRGSDQGECKNGAGRTDQPDALNAAGDAALVDAAAAVGAVGAAGACRRADDRGRIVDPNDARAQAGFLGNLNMMPTPGGRERTGMEYRRLPCPGGPAPQPCRPQVERDAHRRGGASPIQRERPVQA